MDIFVYGTLRKGLGNHILISPFPYIGTGVATGTLYEYGIPFLVEKGNTKVVGEVYSIPSPWVAYLDSFENWYVRKKIKVTLNSGEIIEAQAYIWEAEIFPEMGIITSGDFKKFSEDKEKFFNRKLNNKKT